MTVETQWCSTGLAGQPLAAPGMVWVVVDTETTGLNPAHDRLTEFAATVLDRDGTVIERVSWLSADGDDALQAHGDALERYIERGVFVAHNVSFDTAVLAHAPAFAGTAIAAPARWLCTMQLSGRPMRLDVLAQLIGVDCQARHTAKGDAETLSAVFARLLDLARARGLRTVGELAVVCPTGHGDVAATRERGLGWERVRSALDHVVPKRFPGREHRAAVVAAWVAQPDPSLGPVTVAANDAAVADLRAADVSALLLDLCLEELHMCDRAGLTASDT